MKRLLILSGALALGALVFTGCSTLSRQTQPPRPRAFALAVTVYGTIQPTPAQWAAVQMAAARELAANGFVLVSDLALADRIIRVDFTPNPADPENSGRAVVLGFMPNPYRTSTRAGALGQLTYHPSTSAPRMWTGSYHDRSLYYDPMYTYSWYSDGYTYHGPSGAVVPVAPKVEPPPRRPNPRITDDTPSGRGSSTRFGGYPRGDYRRTPTDPNSGIPRDNSSGSGSSYSSGSSSSSSSSSGSSSYDSSSYSSSSSGYSSSSSSYSAPAQSDRSDSTRRDNQP